MAPITRGKVKQIQESFPPFMEMPKEVRLMVWKEAMPDYGILQLVCKYQDPCSLRPFSIAVELPPTNRRGPAFSMRMQTTRALLGTCRESRVELQCHFPHLIPSSGAELRFHSTKDTIFLSDLDEYFNRGAQIKMNLMKRFSIFGDHWNLLPQKLAMDSSSLEEWLRELYPSRYAVTLGLLPGAGPDFQTFLSNFPKLRQLFLTAELDVPLAKWNRDGEYMWKRLSNILQNCYTSGTNWTDERPRRWGFQMRDLPMLTLAADHFNRILHEDPEAPENAPWKELMRSCPPQLQHVEVFPMVHVHPELEYLCQKVPTE